MPASAKNHKVVCPTRDHDTAFIHVLPPSPIDTAISGSHGSRQYIPIDTREHSLSTPLHLRPEVGAVWSRDLLSVTKPNSYM